MDIIYEIYSGLSSCVDFLDYSKVLKHPFIIKKRLLLNLLMLKLLRSF